VLEGTKTWISNGGIADFYVVFARADEGISAFIVDAPEVDASERIDIVAPHPMSTLKLKAAKAELLGEAGQGFKLAMRNLDLFRTTVGAAALGFARRALDEALARAKDRRMFGQALAEFQMTQAKLADMATQIDAAALLTYRAAWTRDVKKARVTREAAMAKMYATEAAQRVIDEAVQICGGLGVKRGHPVERLYREVRALRIYEGATEVQKLIIARELLKS
jgi:acyl-CoA dehydrogenase